MKIFEYGSGGSTIFFSQRVNCVISIEHDPLWFKKLKEEIIFKGIQNVNMKLIVPTKIEDVTSDKIYCTTHDKRFINYNFFDYVNIINTFPDQHFDLICIDGRARINCLNFAIQKVKCGGYIVFDNGDRSNYLNSLNQIASWRIHKSLGPTIASEKFTETHIY